MAEDVAGELAVPREENRWLPALTATLDRPLATPWCVLGWLASAGLFVALIGIFGGPSYVDVQESLYGTLTIAHGEFACAYPTGTQAFAPPLAPVYPLISGGLSAILRVGHTVPFPPESAMGPGCHKVALVLNQWIVPSRAYHVTVWLGSVCWLALMAGVIAWLRAAGRGRTVWEPVTLLLVAGLLPVWMSVQTFFHPQDVLALGFGLWAMACARRDRWLWAGVLGALAVLSHQYALLVVVPLFVLAPAAKKVRLVGGGLVTGAVIVLPFAILTSGRVLHAIVFGTGDEPYPGGTVMWETHASGAAGVLLYRVAPLVVSLALSWWVWRRLGSSALEAVPLLALVAVSLGLRLVFEVNMFTYYFIALSVSLAVLEATRGSIRRTTVAWFAALLIFICRISEEPFGSTGWGNYMENDLIPLFIGGTAVLAALRQLQRGRDRRYFWCWIAVAVVVLFTLIPGGNRFSAGHVIWFWQIILVVPGVLLAAQPLRDKLRRAGRTTSASASSDERDPPAGADLEPVLSREV